MKINPEIWFRLPCYLFACFSAHQFWRPRLPPWGKLLISFFLTTGYVSTFIYFYLFFISIFFSIWKVVSVYMGFTFNLVDWWEPYKCSKAAMSNTTQASNIKQIVTKNVDKLQVSVEIFLMKLALNTYTMGWISFWSSIHILIHMHFHELIMKY